MHYETELVIRIGKNGKHIDESFALNYVDAITTGIDFTARDVQARQKEKGLPGRSPKHLTKVPLWVVGKMLIRSEMAGRCIFPCTETVTLCNIGTARI